MWPSGFGPTKALLMNYSLLVICFLLFAVVTWFLLKGGLRGIYTWCRHKLDKRQR